MTGGGELGGEEEGRAVRLGGQPSATEADTLSRALLLIGSHQRSITYAWNVISSTDHCSDVGCAAYSVAMYNWG